MIENAAVNTVDNKGLKITSTAMVSCYYDIAHGFNGDIYALKGSNGLGFKFTLPFQMIFSGNNLPSYTCSFTIVATEDNTTVTITPKNDLWGHVAGVPFSILLNRGETYTCQAATNTPVQRPGGTLVISSKPISISTKDDSIAYLTQGCRDTAGDQLIPDCNAGTSFVITKGQLNGPDYYFVFAINDNTIVSVNGAVVSTLGAGDYYMGILPDPSCSVQSSSPVQVFHITGFGCELGGAVVPSVDNEGSSFVGVTRATTSPFYINVITASPNIGGFMVNGSATIVQATDFSTVPGTSGNWMVARVPISIGVAGAGQNIRIQNSTGKFHIGMIHGDLSSTTRYGYFSDFERININLSPYDTFYCKGSDITITGSANGAANFQWTGPNGFTTTGPVLHLSNFQIGDQGLYTISATTSRCGYVERKIWLGLQQPVADFPTPASQCFQGNNFQFNSSATVNAGSIALYTWNFGDANSAPGSVVNHSYNTVGTYTVKLLVTTDRSCKDSIEKTVTVWENPSTTIIPGGPISFCEDRNSVLNSLNQAGTGTIDLYQWNVNTSPIPGANTSSLIINQSGSYTLEVRNSQGCRQVSAPIVVTVHPLPTGSLTNPVSTNICEGGSVLLTATGGNSYQWYWNTSLLPGNNSSTLIATQPGIYTTELISAAGCRKAATGSVTLALIRKPVADFTHNAYCAWVLTPFNNLSTFNNSGPINWNWNFGDGNSATTFSASHTYQQAGSFPVTLTLTPSLCPNLVTTLTKIISIEERQNDMRYPIRNVVKNQPVNLQARTFGSSYSWTPGSGLSSTIIANPVFRYDQSMEYFITIRAQSSCVTVDTLSLRVFNSIDILVPTGFTPNGDGLNDKLEFFLIGIEEFKYLRIYNRWGQPLFETNTEKRCWDGTFQGSQQPSGVFVWVAEGTGFDGNKVFRKGVVTLIRK